MQTRDIRTSTPIMICDVCGRTLLRGEHAHAFMDAGERRSVCELCTSRAAHEGWVREGTEPPYQTRDGHDRPSLLGRFRRGRERRVPLAAEFENPPVRAPAPLAGSNGGGGRSLLARLRARDEEAAAARAYEREPVWDEQPSARPAPAPPPAPVRERVREPRHVRAIPTSTEKRFALALEAFNGSEQRRTVAGVGRSLGMPAVAVRQVPDRHGLIEIVVSWELCWYRYEVDLSEDVPGVRVLAQGYELDELDPAERRANAVADHAGALSLR